MNEVDSEQGESEQIIPLQQLKGGNHSKIKSRQYQQNNLPQSQNTQDQNEFSNNTQNVANLSRPVSLKSGTAPTFAASTINTIDKNFSDDNAQFLTKEGSYFPKAGTSQIILGTTRSFGSEQVWVLKANIRKISDTYNRLLTIYCAGKIVLNQYTLSDVNNKIKIDIGQFLSGSKAEIRFEITWGGYVEHGWMLDYAYLETSSGNDARVLDTQFFPKSYISKIETDFIGGKDTRLSLKIEKSLDSYGRFFSVEVDNKIVVPETAVYNSYSLTSFSLSDFEPRSSHRLTLIIRSGAAVEKGWVLNLLKINYEAIHVEVDWMDGYKPSDAVINYMETYYESNGYERLVFHVSSTMVNSVEYMSQPTLRSYYDTKSWVKTGHPDNHRYMLFGNKQDDGALGWNLALDDNGTHYEFYPVAFIAVQAIRDLPTWNNWRTDDEKIKSVALHELGHTFTILKWYISGKGEAYDWGNRPYSVMFTFSWKNSGPNSFYSKFWWVGDGKWWELRILDQVFESITPKLMSEVNI